MFRRILIFFSLISLFSPLAAERPSMPLNTGALGMGDTWMTDSGSVLATAFNPSLLGMSFRNPFRITTGLILNGDAFRLMGSTGSDIKKYSQSGIASAPSDLITRLQSFRARYSGGMDISYRGEGFGITIYATGKGEVEFLGATTPEGSVTFDQDTGIVVGFGLPVIVSKRGNFALYTGINLRYVNRLRFRENNVTFEDSGAIVDPFDMHTDFLMGQAISSDMAATIVAGKLTVTLAWRNWFGMGFSWKKYDSQWNVIDENVGDTHVSQSLDVGIRWTFRSLFGLSTDLFSNTTLSLDIRGFLVEEDSFFKMLHAGFRTTLLHFLTIDFGFNKGYPTFGLSALITGTVHIGYALFSEETGIMPGQDPSTSQVFTLGIYF